MDDSSRQASSRYASSRKGRASKRFLPPEEKAPRGPGELFAESQWQVIRVQLERDGWNPSQIELLRDQLRQGWSLAIAKQNVAQLTGHCPLHSRSDQRFL